MTATGRTIHMDGEEALEEVLVLEGARNRSHPIRWFAAGASTVAVMVAAFLYATGYFAASEMGANADEPNVIIESQN